MIAAAAAALATPALARQGFGEAQVRALARALGARPYQPPPADLPPALAALTYDDYRDIRFDPSQAMWKADGLPFQLQFFHRGGYFKDRVDLYELHAGRSTPIAYRASQFSFQRGAPAGLAPTLGFAGFRIHAPINRPDYFDEVGVFLGATYFRAVARDMLYGLSARGFSIGTGGVEEFPSFRAFWIERPAPDATAINVLALMDGPSCAGAFRFLVTPGAVTTFDVTAHIFPRRAIADAGIAPLTSMYLFGEDAGAKRFDDFRPEVHDSDGLAVANGAGERLWRPLANPAVVQASAFADQAPAGFGLVQRERRFEAYQDLEAHYEKRPSLWVEPRGSWGAGEVRLIELPSRLETNDNIAAFWTPAAPLVAGTEAVFAYRLNWGADPLSDGRGRVTQTRSGEGSAPGRRRFVLDFDLPTDDLAGVAPRVTADLGQVVEVHLEPNPQRRGVRLSFELDPAGHPTIELRALLLRSDSPCSEVWLSRWTA